MNINETIEKKKKHQEELNVAMSERTIQLQRQDPLFQNYLGQLKQVEDILITLEELKKHEAEKKHDY